MTRKFKNKYRVDTVRAKWWDYTNNGSYFVTICTKDRQHFFGNIVETPKLGVTAKMELNEIDGFREMPQSVFGDGRVDVTENVRCERAVMDSVEELRVEADGKH